MSRRKTKVFIAIIAGLLILGIGCGIYVSDYYHADDAALSAMTGTEDVAVSQMTDMTVLNPRIRWLDSSSTPAARYGILRMLL